MSTAVKTNTKAKAKAKTKTKTRGNDRRKEDYFDFNLVAVIVLLTCFGLVMLYSASAYEAQVEHGSDMFYFGKQALISAAGILISIVISRFDYHILQKLTTPIYVAALILLGLVQSPLGVEVNGARRWLNLGIQFQPSEIAKIAVIVCVPSMIVIMGKNVQTLKGTCILAAVGGLLGICTYLFTENLSTGIIIMGITAALIFIAHPKTKPFLIIAGAAVFLVVVAVALLVSSMETSSSFRIRRVLVWLHPEDYPSYGGYQVMQGLYAIGSGGIFGKGLGNSVQKLLLPEAQNDMIFSIVCEELGIFGGMILLLLFGYLLYRLFFIAQNAPDLFGSLMVSGIFVHVSLQVILNICVVVNVIPTTGITLPFVSYGGTSILFLMAEMGMALSVSRRIKFQEPLKIPEL